MLGGMLKSIFVVSDSHEQAHTEPTVVKNVLSLICNLTAEHVVFSVPKPRHHAVRNGWWAMSRHFAVADKEIDLICSEFWERSQMGPPWDQQPDQSPQAAPAPATSVTSMTMQIPLHVIMATVFSFSFSFSPTWA